MTDAYGPLRRDIGQLNEKLHDVTSQRDYWRAQVEQMRDEIAQLGSECRAKGEALIAMQARLDMMASERDAAKLSHEGQKRNTEAFMRERDELRETLNALANAADRFAVSGVSFSATNREVLVAAYDLLERN